MKLLVLMMVGLTWTRAEPSPAPEPEECRNLNVPLSLENKALILGRFNFLVGYTDNKLYRTLLNQTKSFWFNISETSTGLELNQFNQMNRTCVKSKASAMIEGNTVRISVHNLTSEFQFVKSSRSSLILDIRAWAHNVHSFVQTLNLDPSEFEPELKARSFYLMSRDPVVSSSDLQRFLVHAECAGFSGEPDFTHNSTHEFCSEEESILVIF